MAVDPMRTIAVERELAGQRTTLRVERLRLSDGTETLRDTLYHPRSVAILPLKENGDVVMVRQYRKAAGSEMLELPAGVLEDYESPLDGARRELREETGLDAKELTPVGNFFSSPGSTTERLYAFMARGMFASPLVPDDDERISVVRVSFTEAVQMAREGTLNDAKTIASLLLVAPYVQGI